MPLAVRLVDERDDRVVVEREHDDGADALGDPGLDLRELSVELRVGVALEQRVAAHLALLLRAGHQRGPDRGARVGWLKPIFLVTGRLCDELELALLPVLVVPQAASTGLATASAPAVAPARPRKRRRDSGGRGAEPGLAARDSGSGWGVVGCSGTFQSMSASAGGGCCGFLLGGVTRGESLGVGGSSGCGAPGDSSRAFARTTAQMFTLGDSMHGTHFAGKGSRPIHRADPEPGRAAVRRPGRARAAPSPR